MKVTPSYTPIAKQLLNLLKKMQEVLAFISTPAIGSDIHKAKYEHAVHQVTHLCLEWEKEFKAIAIKGQSLNFGFVKAYVKSAVGGFKLPSFLVDKKALESWLSPHFQGQENIPLLEELIKRLPIIYEELHFFGEVAKQSKSQEKDIEPNAELFLTKAARLQNALNIALMPLSTENHLNTSLNAEELLLAIFSYLDLGDLEKTQLVSKQFFYLSNELIEAQLKKHFSSDYPNIKTACMTEFPDFLPKIQFLFYLLEIGDNARFISLVCNDDFNAINKNSTTLLNLARKLNNQEILNHCYKLKLAEIKNRPSIQEKVDLHMLACLTRQPTPVIESFFKEIGEHRIVWCRTLELAVLDKRMDIMELIIKEWKLSLDLLSYFMASISYPLLSQAVKNNDITMLKLLLLYDMDVNKLCPRKGETALHIAIYHGHVTAIELLLAHRGVNVNKENRSRIPLLLWAVINQRIEEVKLLLNHTNIQVNLIGRIDTQKTSPLTAAANLNNLIIVKTLLTTPGIQVNGADSEHHTPLFVAASKGHYEVAEQLLIHNADPSLTSPQNYSKILARTTSDNKRNELNEILTKYYANAETNSSQALLITPLEASVFFGHMQIVRLLLTRGTELTQEKGNFLIRIAEIMEYKHIIAELRFYTPKNKVEESEQKQDPNRFFSSTDIKSNAESFAIIDAPKRG